MHHTQSSAGQFNRLVETSLAEFVRPPQWHIDPTKDSCGKAISALGYGENAQHFNTLIHSFFSADPTMESWQGWRCFYNHQSRPLSMRKKTEPNSRQIVLFPTGDPVPLSGAEGSGSSGTDERPSHLSKVRTETSGCEVVLSGSFRRDVEGLRRIHEELIDLGCLVLSPTRVEPSREVDGFVFMSGEETESPERIELKHLEAIQKAAFVWLHAPGGYVGLSAALEVGFAHAQGIPIFSRDRVSDVILGGFIKEVESASEVVGLARNRQLPVPTPNVRTFQRYYKRVASQRGYERESAQNCLLLMVEEIGELARAVRKREKLVRHGSQRHVSEAHELADVFLYVVHMANILGLDLGSAVHDKEVLNIAKLVGSR